MNQSAFATVAQVQEAYPLLDTAFYYIKQEDTCVQYKNVGAFGAHLWSLEVQQRNKRRNLDLRLF
jgi:hypothetical protein